MENNKIIDKENLVLISEHDINLIDTPTSSIKQDEKGIDISAISTIEQIDYLADLVSNLDKKNNADTSYQKTLKKL